MIDLYCGFKINCYSIISIYAIEPTEINLLLLAF